MEIYTDILSASQLGFEIIGFHSTFQWWFPLEKLFGFFPVSLFIKGN